MDTRLFQYQHRPQHPLSEGLVLRPLAPDRDLPQLLSLYNRCFPEWALTPERFEHYLLFGGEILRTWVVQDTTGRLLGTASAAISRDPNYPGAHVHWLCVEPGEREQGIGKRLVERVVAYLVGLGFDSIWAYLAPASEANIKIAQAFGCLEATPTHKPPETE